MVLTNVNSTCMYCITSPFPLHVGATSCSSPFSSSPSSPPFMGKIVPQFVSFSLGGARTSPYFGTFETFGEHSRTYTRAQCGRTWRMRRFNLLGGSFELRSVVSISIYLAAVPKHSAMPKTALTGQEWRRRLTDYAQGRFVFGRGQKPQRGSVWSRVLMAIEKCPKHRYSATTDPFGRIVACSCGYHSVPPPTGQVK